MLFIILMILTILIGRCRPQAVAVKAEPTSPLKKRKSYSTTDADLIGHIDAIDDVFEAIPTNGKHQKMNTGTTARVRFDGVKVPEKPLHTQKATRKSTRTAKASKKDGTELFERLAQEFRAIAQTLEDIATLK